jgi:hypothetical protein
MVWRRLVGCCWPTSHKLDEAIRCWCTACRLFVGYAIRFMLTTELPEPEESAGSNVNRKPRHCLTWHLEHMKAVLGNPRLLCRRDGAEAESWSLHKQRNEGPGSLMCWQLVRLRKASGLCCRLS